MRFTCRAFSSAMAAKSESASSSFKSRASNPSGPMQLISSMTPKHVSRNFTGTATIDCVSVLVFSSTCEKNRVSFDVSGTTTVSPCCATQPAMPCPIFTRTSFNAVDAVPTASSKYNSCLASSSSNSDQLSGRRNSSIFSMIVRNTWSSCNDDVSALPSSWKTATSPASRLSPGSPGFLRRSTAGNCLGSSTLGLVQSLLYASATAQSNGYTTALAAFFFLRFKASIVMRQKCAQPIRGTGVAISPSSACRRGFRDARTCASIPSIRFFFKRLTATWRRTYSASGQNLSPFLPALFRPGGTAVFRQNRGVKIEERFDEMAKGTFGERLKRERELREVTIKEIASATRIAAKFLQALENEEWEKLPGGVFGRGFVRSIARYLGLSEENLLSDYDLARGETSAPVLQKPEERIPSPPKWIPALAVVVLIAALVGMVFGGRYAWRWYAAHRNAKKASAIVRLPSSNADQDPLVNNSPATPASASEKSLLLELSVAASATTHVKV